MQYGNFWRKIAIWKDFCGKNQIFWIEFQYVTGVWEILLRKFQTIFRFFLEYFSKIYSSIFLIKHVNDCITIDHKMINSNKNKLKKSNVKMGCYKNCQSNEIKNFIFIIQSKNSFQKFHSTTNLKSIIPTLLHGD